MKFSAMNAKIWSRLGSCGAFGQAMLEVPALCDEAVMLTSDLQFFSGCERFANKFPDRFYNVGIAEQNMVDVAAGMAKEGFVPFATTYATFASMRAADQVRVSMGYMGLPIKLIGLTAGFSVGILGPTHISIEDIAIMRTIPNVTILSPADCTETVKATLAAARIDGPVYLRLSGAQNNPVVYSDDYDFEVGKAIQLKDGDDIAIIATGTMVHNALRVAEMLETDGISASVLDMHTIKPLDTDAVRRCLGAKLLVTIEEHSAFGGLGGAVAEALAMESEKPRHLIIGIGDDYGHAGGYDWLMEQHGLDIGSLYRRITAAYGQR